MSEENKSPSQPSASTDQVPARKRATKTAAKSATKTAAKSATKTAAKKTVKKAVKKAVKKVVKKAAKKAVEKRVVKPTAAAANQVELFSESSVTPREVKSREVQPSPARQEPVQSSTTVAQAQAPRAKVEDSTVSTTQSQTTQPDKRRGEGNDRPQRRRHPNSNKGQVERTNAGGPAHPNRGPQQSGNDRVGRGNKFNKNKRGKKGPSQGRWKSNKKLSQGEDLPIEFGELFAYELFASIELIHERASELAQAEGAQLDFVRIYELSLPELHAEVAGLDLTVPAAPSRDQLINLLVAHAAKSQLAIITTGVLELLEDDAGGILVYQRDSYRIKSLSTYVPQAFIKAYGLQRGHIVKAQLHPHRENESCPFVVRILQVMGREPETLSEIVPFTELVPYYPLQRILLESEGESKWDNLSMRVVDCLTPIGFGQRGLIVAPPRTGKTVLMQGMANSIKKSYPDSHLIILLIDERPEEVTDFRRQVGGEVICSTFDEAAESHVHAAEMVIEKARRMVEVGEDVIILLDSITRLARAYNTTMPSSGKILSGGVEANALQKPKRFFGSARNIEDGGSLTIIATALVETGSKMDEVIFEEFKGTGNMELHLDRGLSDKRIFPALSLDKSGTRKEELLYHPDEMLKIYSLRRAMKGLPSVEAMEMLIQRIKKTNTNIEFLMSVAR